LHLAHYPFEPLHITGFQASVSLVAKDIQFGLSLADGIAY